jgi:dihydrofolate synthase/folylpolyglutamate synthase
MPNTLADWLTYLESLHPKTIALGLDRVAQVKQRLNLQPDFPIIALLVTDHGFHRTTNEEMRK